MEPLSVELAGFYPLENAKENRTEKYELVRNTEVPTPVLRRGENFFFAVRFNRDFDEENDAVRISFGFGPRPNVFKGTRVVLPLFVNQKVFPRDSRRWGLCLDRVAGDTITMRAHISSVAQVGIWSCAVHTSLRGVKGQRNDYKCREDIYILFNPWCRDDPVYMENEDELEEYVLNETGKIWMGTYRNPKGKSWVFGQFDDASLPASVLLLDRSALPYADRGSPVLVSRAISAVINANDEDGLIAGRWDGQYEDGTSPFAWTGSSAILDEFLKTGHPVKYGQCWVFAAATVTVCRALGIPCRCVTNYVSAHDMNNSLTVDRYFDVYGNKIEDGPNGLCSEMCWNFHVWDDVWMARPDLPSGYGGWQIIDATPQEKSDSSYRCGPASVEAVRKGEVGYSYDTPFVFAEVNADICHFKEDEESDWGFIKILVNKYHVGRKVITKRPGVDDREGDSDIWDVTTFYKNPEGSEAERLAVFNAIKGIPLAHQFYDVPKEVINDVTFDLVEMDVVPLGESFDAVVNIHNESDEERNITGMISISSVYYNGAAAHTVKKAQGTCTIGPREKEFMKIRVTPEEYVSKLVDHHLLKIYALATVQDTKQTWSEEDDFMVTKPALTISLQDSPKVGERCNVTLSFENPLEVPLTNCRLTMEGPSLQRPKVIAFREVEPKESITIEETFVPRAAGEKVIVVNFTSSELQGIEGSANFSVEE